MTNLTTSMTQNMTARYAMPTILKETKRMARSRKMEATSGWEMRRWRKGVRCVWRVVTMPRTVESAVMRGLRRVDGRYVERRGR